MSGTDTLANYIVTFFKVFLSVTGGDEAPDESLLQTFSSPFWNTRRHNRVTFFSSLKIHGNKLVATEEKTVTNILFPLQFST